MRKRLVIGWMLALLINLLGLAAFTATEAQAAKFAFLEALEQRPEPWTPEITDEVFEAPAIVDTDLTDHYREFAEDGTVRIFIGYGYEAYFRGKGQKLFEMLKAIAEKNRLTIGNWQLSADQLKISFRDMTRSVDYVVRIGTERNAFMNAFSDYEIVMYTGHSRYGRGPAFESFWNYFRMGDRFETIEVDTRNPYFRSEPTQLLDRFPVFSTMLDGLSFAYQYRGQRTSTSYLPENAFTRNIPGKSVDLVRTRFLPRRQIFYFQSCKNERYWRRSLRTVLPDPSQKFIFGTWKDSLGGIRPDAVLIMSMVQGIHESRKVVDDLNAAEDCDGCFTSY